MLVGFAVGCFLQDFFQTLEGVTRLPPSYSSSMSVHYIFAFNILLHTSIIRFYTFLHVKRTKTRKMKEYEREREMNTIAYNIIIILI